MQRCCGVVERGVSEHWNETRPASVWSRATSFLTLVSPGPVVTVMVLDDISGGENPEMTTSPTPSTTTFDVGKNGDNKEFNCDVALISIGRKPFTSNLNLSSAGIKSDEKGRSRGRGKS